jgi:uncharacterized membrane protein YphA (DoxX/SURF4 family)
MLAQPRSATAAASLLAELVGGLLVGFGLLASPGGAATIGLVLFVVVATYLGHRFWDRSGDFAFPLSLAGAMVALTLAVAMAGSPASLHRVLGEAPVGRFPLAGLAIAILGAFLVLASREIRRRAGPRRPAS